MQLLLYTTIAIFFLVTFVKPNYGICFLTFLLFYHARVFEALGGGFFVSHLPALFGFFVIIMLIFRPQHTKYSHEVLIPFIIFFLLTLILPTVLSTDLQTSALESMNIMKNAVFAILISCFVRDKRIILQILITIIIIGLLGSIEGLYLFFFQKGDSMLDIERYGGLRGDPNNTAMVLVPVIGVAFFFYRFVEKRALKFGMVASAIVLTVGVMATYSRGGFLAMAFLWICVILKNAKRISFISIALAAIVLLTLLSPSLYIERIETLVSPDSEIGKSLAGRKEALKAGVRMFWTHPLLGVGIGRPPYEISKYMGATVQSFGMKRSRGPVALHNMFLEMAAGGGMPVIISFLCLLLASLLTCYRTYERTKNLDLFHSEAAFYLGIGMAGMCLAGLFLSTERHSVLWLLIGLSGSFANSAQNILLQAEQGSEPKKITPAYLKSLH